VTISPTLQKPEPMVAIQLLSACRILVINGKGGSGKTTLSTNLAAWLAKRGETTVLVDTDPQASASYWLKSRPENLPKIFGVKIEPNSRITRSFQWRAPKSTRWLITDSAPGLADIRASARFIGELLLTQTMRHKRRPIAVVANRVKQQTNAWERLQKFLLSLNIPYPATLRDTQFYVKAYGEGRGIADYHQQSHERDRNDWGLILCWLDAQMDQSAWQDAENPDLDDLESSNAS
jgi:chromosome partitioning protein